jgi:hypothetical protein
VETLYVPREKEDGEDSESFKAKAASNGAANPSGANPYAALGDGQAGAAAAAGFGGGGMSWKKKMKQWLSVQRWVPKDKYPMLWDKVCAENRVSAVYYVYCCVLCILLCTMYTAVYCMQFVWCD